MKKLFILVAAAAAMTFTACTGEGAQTGGAVENDSTAVAELTVDNFEGKLDSLITAGDSVAVKDLLDKSQAQVDALIAAGDTVAAKSFFQKVVEVVNASKDKIVALAPTLGSAVTGVTANVPETLKGIVTEGLDTLGKAAIDEAKAKAEQVVNNAVTEEAKAAVEDAKAKGQELKEAGKAKVEEGKAKVEEVKKAADDVKEAAKSVKEAGNALKNLGK